MSLLSRAAIAAGAMMLAWPAAASNILVSSDPWDWNYAVNNMADVFGSDFTVIDAYDRADVGTVFSAANRFVDLEGSDKGDIALAAYLKTNTAPISSWVAAGGHLLIQSSGEHVPNTVTFAGVSLTRTASTPNRSGTLTAAGTAVLSAFFVPPHPSGASLAEDVITGSGLTVLMTGDDNGGAIVASKRYGRGSILYSALTDSEFHYPGPGGLLGDTNGLVDSTIAAAAFATAASTVPLPASAALLGTALLGLCGWSFGAKRRAAAAPRGGGGRRAASAAMG